MIGYPLKRTLIRAAVLSSLSFGLTGCGGDGVELNGRIFDLMGVSESAQRAAAREPKLKERTGLVLPPNAAALPEPGSGTDPDVDATLNDPDKKRQMAAAERARQHKAYCSGELTWKERAKNKDLATGAHQSPYGPCSMFGEILKQ